MKTYQWHCPSCGHESEINESYSIANAIRSLERANGKIVKKTRYSCGLQNFPRQREKIVTGFFLSQNDENAKLFYLLLDDGWKTAGYHACYNWRVMRGSLMLSYIEGDIALYEV